MREWDKAEARSKAEIARITAEASKRANIKAEVRLRERDDSTKRKTEEAGARIRDKVEAEA